ncbi:hypothetical protein, partial [Pseudomonas agarici]|uniref:hypothetical protein n=1 Tax=Pseudomonas agarici TaxID=46677 RepID=UPI001B7F8DD2
SSSLIVSALTLCPHTGNLFRKMTFEQQLTLLENTARKLKGISLPVIQFHIDHCTLLILHMLLE